MKKNKYGYEVNKGTVLTIVAMLTTATIALSIISKQYFIGVLSLASICLLVLPDWRD